MKINNEHKPSDRKMSIEDQKAIEALNIHFKFRQNMSKIKSHFGF